MAHSINISSACKNNPLETKSSDKEVIFVHVECQSSFSNSASYHSRSTCAPRSSTSGGAKAGTIPRSSAHPVKGNGPPKTYLGLEGQGVCRVPALYGGIRGQGIRPECCRTDTEGSPSSGMVGLGARRLEGESCSLRFGTSES